MILGPQTPLWMPAHWVRAVRYEWAARAAARATTVLVLAFCVAHAVWGPCVRPWYAASAALWVLFVWRLDTARAASERRAALLDAVRRR